MLATKNKTEKLIITSAWISVSMSLLIFLIKFFAYLQTQSQAVLSDALESIVNVVASTAALFVLKAVAEPADEEHPYGHGKLEYFSSAFEGGLIAFAAIVIAYSAIQALMKGSALNELEIGVVVMIVAGVLNLLLGLHLYSVGKAKKSEALVASAKHVISDVVTTVGVIIGLGLVKLTGWIFLDPLAALLVALHLLNEGVKIVRRSIGGLIDEMDKGVLQEFATLFTRLRKTGMIDIHNLKLIRSGRFHHIDGHLVVPQFWDISKAHEMNDEFEKDLMEAYPYDCEVAFHLDPCNQSYCQSCDLKDCPIRKEPFHQMKQFTPESLIQVPAADVRGIGHHER